MLKKPITYKNQFTGEEITEVFYFSLTKSELIRLEVSEGSEGLGEALSRMVAAQNPKLLLATFERILLSAYGERSADGVRFLKSEAISEDFKTHPAYDVLFMEIVTNAEFAATFVKSIIPADISIDEPVVNTVQLPTENDSDVVQTSTIGTLSVDELRRELARRAAEFSVKKYDPAIDNVSPHSD